MYVDRLIYQFRYTAKIANAYNVPLFISDEVLVDYPPSIIYGCEHDILKNDSQMFHSRLTRLNKKSKIHIWKGALHAHLVLSGSRLFLTTLV